jgi:protein SHQ1
MSFEGSYAISRADYADDEYIQELIDWVPPYVALAEHVQYTDEETETMLRLPRKECKP